MRQHQKGEVMLAVMIVMMAVVWIVSGRMRGMGEMMIRDDHSEKPPTTQQQTETQVPPAHKEPTDDQTGR
ncbi:MAG: hypothetical protein KGQ44_00590 [Betaproteobacteria bacterium]|jgi:hypothetical protein|nr:hypothetical protein [Betaproteobacteria bacterium]